MKLVYIFLLAFSLMVNAAVIMKGFTGKGVKCTAKPYDCKRVEPIDLCEDHFLLWKDPGTYYTSHVSDNIKLEIGLIGSELTYRFLNHEKKTLRVRSFQLTKDEKGLISSCKKWD